MRQVCFASSLARPMPLSLALKEAVSPMAVMTKTRLPHTIGLECESPGTGVFHAMFSDFSRLQLVGVLCPSAMPEALRPRNEGQFCACTVRAAKQRQPISDSILFIFLPPVQI